MSDRHMEKAREIGAQLDIPDWYRFDINIIATALAEAHREGERRGMERAAEMLPSSPSMTLADAVVHAAYNSDEDARKVFDFLGGATERPE